MNLYLGEQDFLDSQKEDVEAQSMIEIGGNRL